MKLDPRHLRPSQATQLLNSTPLGTVVSERQLHRHRSRAGLRIGDGKTIDLPRYVAWLVIERHRPRPEPDGLTGYEAMKERAAQRNREIALLGRDIGDLPAAVDLERRARCERDFRRFCEEYFPATFYLEWSPDHLKVIGKIEQAVLHGGLFAMAMPRGSGKSSLCETACVWALVYGHRGFVALIGSDEAHAENMLDAIKIELESNDRLLEDFPEVCFPIRALEGIHQRASGQLYNGRQTHIGWTAREIVLPTIAGSRASGGIIRVAGITGRVRGMKFKRTDGTAVRPSLVLIDDPQTDESARSPSQCANRERILAGAVLGLAGPGRKIAGLMTLTVICAGDLADRILDRDKHPDWQGERTKMVYAFPTNETLWARYAAIRAEELRADRTIAAATEFYRQNQAEMDAGAVVAWEHRFNADEISALQHAMNLRLQNEAAFQAEFQNEPLAEAGAEEEVTIDTLAARLSGLARGIVPAECTRLTMFVDVQKKALYWLVAAWGEDFSGSIIDYGTFPDQQLAYYSLGNLRYTLGHVFPTAGVESAVEQGLTALAAKVIGREWPCEDGSTRRIDHCLIDANWQETSEAVFRFARASVLPVHPSFGRAVGPGQLPFTEYKRRPGERIGLNWRMGLNAQRRRRVIFDANFWKSFVYSRLATSFGDSGALGFFGKGRVDHRALFEHLTSESRTRAKTPGRIVDLWVCPPGRDNHWFDCLVGAAVAASIEGCALEGVAQRAAKPNAAAARPRSALQRAGAQDGPRALPGPQRLTLEELRKRRLAAK